MLMAPSPKMMAPILTHFDIQQLPYGLAKGENSPLLQWKFLMIWSRSMMRLWLFLTRYARLYFPIPISQFPVFSSFGCQASCPEMLRRRPTRVFNLHLPNPA
jgi:hypothetical protein